MKNSIFFLFAWLGLFSAVGQEISSYNYIIVPQEYDFLKRPDQYELNALTKFLFQKKGFNAVMEDEEFPEELGINRCKGLVADVKSDSGIFSTKLLVTLKDCNNREVFVSEEGSSRSKDFKVAFHEALRNAFESIPERNIESQVAEVVAQPEDSQAGYEPIEESVVVGRPEIDTTEGVSPVNGEVVKNLPNRKSNSIMSGTALKEHPDKKFSKGNGVYFLKKTEKGFDFYQEGMGEPFAALIKSSAGTSYIYSSINSKGIAQFDEQGNLVVEILNNDSGSLESIVYKLKD